MHSRKNKSAINEVMSDLPPPAHVQTVAAPSFSTFYHSKQASFSPDSTFIQKAKDYIRPHEGKHPQAYRDHKGNWTIGVGHLLTKDEPRILNDEQIEQLFTRDVQAKLHEAQRIIGPLFSQFSEPLKIAIVDGFFRGDLAKSPKTLHYLKNKQFHKASVEYLNNDEYRHSFVAGTGVAKRMKQNAAIMAAEH